MLVNNAVTISPDPNNEVNFERARRMDSLEKAVELSRWRGSWGELV